MKRVYCLCVFDVNLYSFYFIYERRRGGKRYSMCGLLSSGVVWYIYSDMMRFILQRQVFMWRVYNIPVYTERELMQRVYKWVLSLEFWIFHFNVKIHNSTFLPFTFHIKRKTSFYSNIRALMLLVSGTTKFTCSFIRFVLF